MTRAYSRDINSNRIQCKNATDKYVGPPYCRAEMYAGHVTCCPLVSHSEYVTDRQTNGQMWRLWFFPLNSIQFFIKDSILIRFQFRFFSQIFAFKEITSGPSC